MRHEVTATWNPDRYRFDVERRPWWILFRACRIAQRFAGIALRAHRGDWPRWPEWHRRLAKRWLDIAMECLELVLVDILHARGEA